MAFGINKKNIIFLGLILIIAFLLYDRYQITNKKNAEEIKLRDENNKSIFEKNLETQKVRILADSLFLAENYEDALSLYSQLASAGTESEQFFENRKLLAQKRKADNLTNEEINKMAAQLKSQLQNQITIHAKQLTVLSNKNAALYQALNEVRDSQTRLEQLLTDSIRQLNISLLQMGDSSKDVLTFSANKDGSIHYVGEVKDNKAHGYGIGLWTSGGKYTGQWLNNKRHGTGIYHWKDGESYEGDYYHDMRHGTGKYVWKSGIYYIGGWKEDKRHGQGILYEKNGNIRLQGNWNDDEFKKSELK